MVNMLVVNYFMQFDEVPHLMISFLLLAVNL